MKFLGLLSVGFVCMSSLEAMSLSQQEKKVNDAQLRSADVMRRSTSGSSGEDEQGSGQEQKENQMAQQKKEFVEEEIQPMKFLNDEVEKERVRQIIEGITEQFNSELLGFFRVSNSVFFADSPIQQLEEWCVVYDINELAQLEKVQNLKNTLQNKVKGNDLYPRVRDLLQKLKDHVKGV